MLSFTDETTAYAGTGSSTYAAAYGGSTDGFTDGGSTAVGSTTYASTARAYAFAYAPAPIFAAAYFVLVTGARYIAAGSFVRVTH